jgi:hypothetical protein
MMGIASRLFAPKPAPPESDPQPRRLDYPDEHSFLTAHLVWQCGGKGRLTPDKLEIAAICAALMIDVRSARAGDLVRNADVLEKLMARLPISRSQSVRETITDGMSLQQVSNLYGRMCGDPGCFDDVVTVAETPDEPAPTAAARAPEPPPATASYRPAPENVSTVPFPKAASPSTQDFADLIEKNPHPTGLRPELPSPVGRCLGRSVSKKGETG